jgi:ribose-phosphate pyrophosphokinase
MSKRRPILVYLPGAEELTGKIHHELGDDWQLIPAQAKYFADGEVKVVLPRGEENSVRGAETYLVQTPSAEYPHSRQDLFFELCSATAALTECDAFYRNVVMPWYHYACQDKPREREPLTAKLAADMLTVSGATRVIAVDVHNDAIKGFFDRRQCGFFGLYASGTLLRCLDSQFHILEESSRDQFAISGVDQGSGNRVKRLAKHTRLMPVLPTKVKNYETNETREVIIREPVAGRTVIIWDDMIRSASTIVETANALKEHGAKNVIMVATHANFCADAVLSLEALWQQGFLLKVLSSDSFHFPEEFTKSHPWFEQVSLAGILAETISNLHAEKSVARVYLDDRPIM